MPKHDTDFAINDSSISVGETWEELLRFAQNRVNDNNMSKEYPLEVRKRQMLTLKTLVQHLDKNHSVMEVS